MNIHQTRILIIIGAISFGIAVLGMGRLLFISHSFQNLVPSPIIRIVHHSKDPMLATSTSDGKLYQYVVFAFDGSRSLIEWRKTIDFASSMKTAGAPLYFTYFINAIYLVPETHKDMYHPPHNPVGMSMIGYGTTAAEIGARIALINEAYQSGHEIGSHGVGHIPGYKWNTDDWKSELTQFKSILERVRHGIDTTVPLTVPEDAIVGFRAPDLAVGTGLDIALDSLGYRYDASHTNELGMWPHRSGKHMEVPLALIPYESTSTILSMDYNFYISDSHAHDILKKGTPLWQRKHDDMLAAYMNYFKSNYNGNRAPIFIGHHFSEWNDGLYWDVMQEAARAMCCKPDVRCATYQETLDYLQNIKK